MAEPVFISHSSVDKDIANQICEELETLGVACWIAPRDVPPGARYGEAIFKSLETTSGVVLVLSENSNASEQVMNEVERALSNKKEIFPLKIDEVVPSPEMNYFIGRRHRLDATLNPLDELIEQLAEAVKTTVTEGPSTGSATSSAPPSSQPRAQTPSRKKQAQAAAKKRKLMGGVAAAVVIAGVVGYLVTRGPAKPDLTELPMAYEALKQDDWAQAEKRFQTFRDQANPLARAQGYAGLGAVAWARWPGRGGKISKS